MENVHRDLSKERERGREERRDSRDLINRSLKTNGQEEGAELQKGLQSTEDRKKASRDLPKDLWKRERESRDMEISL